jgi:hypothetical protein
MFERYTEKARRVIFFARYEASQFGAPAIEPEHLLLGLMREDKTLTAKFLQRAQASLEAIRKEIEGRAPLREKISTSVELPLAPETKRVLAFAHEESDRLQHRHIGTEHLLLGLLREERSMAAEILLERGLRLHAVRDEVSGFDNVQETSNPILGWAEDLRSYANRLTSIAKQMQRELTNESNDKAGSQKDIAEIIRELSSARQTGKISHEIKLAEKRYRTILGVEKLLSEKVDLLRGARVGLICNQSSVDHHFRHVADLFQENAGVKLNALFGPQHGIRGDVQDNMVETPHVVDALTKLPVYSLYSETREPSEQMLEDVDVLVFDMQDVGCRIYTFIYTLANCMRAAKRFGKKVIVCDRPNPIGGERIAGTILESG